MEHIYTSYCKKIQDTNYYFVKKFQVYPDFKHLPPLLEGYGMHTNFDKACKIAGINEMPLKKMLLQELAGNHIGGKVIEMSAIEKTSKRKRLKFL